MRSLGLIVASLIAAGIVILYSLPMESGSLGVWNDVPTTKTGTWAFTHEEVTPLSSVYSCGGGFDVGSGVISILSGSVFVMQQDPLDRRSIEFWPLRIAPRTQGTIFLIKSSPSAYRLYSFDALADVSIVDWSTTITSFPIFPGIRFVHDVSQHAQLKGADFIRLATLDDVAYVSSVSPWFVDAVVPGSDDVWKKCFEAVRADIGNTLRSGARLQIGQEVDFLTETKPLNPLIHNRAKLLAQYRSDLIAALRPLVRGREAGSAQSVETIMARADADIEHGSTELLPLIQATARSAWAQSRLDEQFVLPPITTLALLNAPWKANEIDRSLSHVFTRVSFLEGRPTEVRDVIFAFLKSAPKEDLSNSLARTYISTEYVLEEAITADTRALEAISLLIGAGDIPYNALKSTSERARLATLLFTDHARVAEEMILRLKTKFFSSVSPVKFRDSYIAGSTLLPDGMEESLGRTINALKKDTEGKKSVYYSVRTESTRDAYLRLTESITLLQSMYDAMGALRERKLLDPATSTAATTAPTSTTQVSWAILTPDEIAQLSPIMKGIENYLRQETVNGVVVIRLVKYPLTIRSGSSVYKLLVSGIFRPQKRDWFRLEASATFDSKQINLIEMPKPLSMDGLVAFAPKLATLLDTAFLRTIRPDQKVSFQIDSVTIDGTSYRTAQ